MVFNICRYVIRGCGLAALFLVASTASAVTMYGHHNPVNWHATAQEACHWTGYTATVEYNMTNGWAVGCVLSNGSGYQIYTGEFCTQGGYPALSGLSDSGGPKYNVNDCSGTNPYPPPGDCASQPPRHRWHYDGDAALPAEFTASDGCRFQADPASYDCGFQSDAANGTGAFYCRQGYNATGESFSPPPEPEPGLGEAPTGAPEDPAEAPQSWDTPPTTTTQSDPPVTSDNDPAPGDTTTTTTTTTTKSDPGAATKTETATDITMSRNGDKITTTTTTTTTTTKADGTTEITRTTQTQTQTAPTTSNTYPRGGGTKTSASSGGGSTTGTSTTTTTIGADGSTSTTTTSSGDANGNGTNDEQEGDNESPQFGEPGRDEGDAGQGIADAWGKVTNAPLVAAFSGFTVAGSSGSCPTFSVNVFDQTIGTDWHCQIWLDVAPILSAVMLAVWGFYGLRVIGSA